MMIWFTMEDTTTTSNNQNAIVTSGTNSKTKECVGTSNKIDNTTTMESKNRAHTKGTNHIKNETNESINKNCTDITKSTTKVKLDNLFTKIDTNMNLILEEFENFLEARKHNAATKNVPTNSDEPEKELRDGNETPIPNQGRKSLVKVYSRSIVYKLKLSNSCEQKHKKRYTDVHFKLDTSHSSKNRTTMTT